jgi:putative ABC transport system permease protein
VVLSYALWQRRFAANPAVIGQSLTFNGKPLTVVGVAGSRFLPFEFYDVQAWVPYHLDTSWRDCFARLPRGLTLPGAQQRLNALTARLAETDPGDYGGYSVTVDPLLQETRDKTRPAFLALVGAAACLLLIAAANVASLLLARTTRQAREISIRAALGAGRVRLYRMVLAESIVLVSSRAREGACWARGC